MPFFPIMHFVALFPVPFFPCALFSCALFSCAFFPVPFFHMPGRYERVRVGWHCAKVKGHAELKIGKSRAKTFIYDFPNITGRVAIRNSSGIFGGFRQLRKVISEVMPSLLGICDAARMNTGVNRQAEGRHNARQTNP